MIRYYVFEFHKQGKIWKRVMNSNENIKRVMNSNDTKQFTFIILLH